MISRTRLEAIRLLIDDGERIPPKAAQMLVQSIDQIMELIADHEFTLRALAANAEGPDMRNLAGQLAQFRNDFERGR